MSTRGSHISFFNDTIPMPTGWRPAYKCYEFIFPPCYQDVKVSPSDNNTVSSMPHYYLKLMGSKALKDVAIEPVIVVRARPLLLYRREGPTVDAHAVWLAEMKMDEVLKVVEKEIGRKAALVEKNRASVKKGVNKARDASGQKKMKYYRRAGERITGSAGVRGAEHLLQRLIEFVGFVGKKSDGIALVGRLTADVSRLRRQTAEMTKMQQSVLGQESR